MQNENFAPLFCDNFANISSSNLENHLKPNTLFVLLIITAKKPILTERHKFFKLLEVAQAVNKKEETNASRENKEVPFTGGMVVFNCAEDRLQILFDTKPDEAMRNRLKREGGMRWSPRNMAWQRQLTPNAVYAVKHYLKLEDCNL